MNPLFQIEIPKRSLSCAGKGERLLPGMEYYSLLTQSDAHQQMSRRDFCVSCWECFVSQQDLLNSRGHWKSKIERKKSTSSSLRSEKALELLKSLLPQAHQHEAEIFVLAIFLSHARRLALRQEFEQEKANWGLYEILQQEEFVTIKMLPLSQIEAASIQRSIAQKLSQAV